MPLLFGDADDFALSEVVRPLAHISESVRVDEVLRETRERRKNVTLVHDEHGPRTTRFAAVPPSATP